MKFVIQNTSNPRFLTKASYKNSKRYKTCIFTYFVWPVESCYDNTICEKWTYFANNIKENCFSSNFFFINNSCTENITWHARKLTLLLVVYKRRSESRSCECNKIKYAKLGCKTFVSPILRSAKWSARF